MVHFDSTTRRGRRSAGRRRSGPEHAMEGMDPPAKPVATTHHSFLGSFSAVSKRNVATKYAFFQVFRDLQNYLADISKKLQNNLNLQKMVLKSQKVAKFLRNFRIFAKKMLIFAKIADCLQTF